MYYECLITGEPLISLDEINRVTSDGEVYPIANEEEIENNMDNPNWCIGFIGSGEATELFENVKTQLDTTDVNEILSECKRIKSYEYQKDFMGTEGRRLFLDDLFSTMDTDLLGNFIEYMEKDEDSDGLLCARAELKKRSKNV